VTKREGEIALARICGMDCVNLRLPAVYGDHFTGRLAVLNRLPPFMRSSGLAFLSAFRPVVKADRVAETVVKLVNGGGTGECIVTDSQDENPVYRFLQRAMDLSFVLVVALILWWLFILAWAAIRLTSPGPAIFVQSRVGRYERIFSCYKFRTMRTGSPQAGTHEVSSSYITPVGRFLRRTKIDELPQIINLLRGEMSLVGPRPCLPGQAELIEWRRKFGVFACRPGITGLAQVEGVDMSEPERLARMDARYCAIRTITLDFRLAICTLFGN
jgi:lipopolysaccharide/colanic/teichoic acid biosynthesis glycosyltransferase